jgi:predicted Zn-dependent peptidase
MDNQVRDVDGKFPALFSAGAPVPPFADGSMEDLTAPVRHVAQFFATYYTPDNAVLDRGDFEPAEARRLVETHFGHPRGRKPSPDMSLPPVFGEWREQFGR